MGLTTKLLHDRTGFIKRLHKYNFINITDPVNQVYKIDIEQFYFWNLSDIIVIKVLVYIQEQVFFLTLTRLNNQGHTCLNIVT